MLRNTGIGMDNARLVIGPKSRYLTIKRQFETGINTILSQSISKLQNFIRLEPDEKQTLINLFNNQPNATPVKTETIVEQIQTNLDE